MPLLIIVGGLGFFVWKDIKDNKLHFHKYTLHTKLVLITTGLLILIPTLIILLAEHDLPWGERILSSFFTAVSPRTAGFNVLPLNGALRIKEVTLFLTILLMFVGGSSGSTAGGIKTSTFFVLIRGIFSAATNQSEKAFHYSIPKDAFKKAAVISILAAGVVITSTYILMILEPQVDLLDALFEMTSAFSTAGLSTGISSDLHLPAKILSIMIMFTGRLGPLTIASLWYFSRGELALYPDGNIVVG